MIGTDLELPEDLISFSKLLFSPNDWERARTKGKLPKPKLDQDAKLLILPGVLSVLERRLAKYPTTLEVSRQSLTQSTALSLFYG